MLGTMVRLALASPTTYATKLGQNKGLGPGLIGGMGSPQGSRRTGPDVAFLDNRMPRTSAEGCSFCSIPRRALGLAQPSGQGDRVFAHPWTCSGHRRARVGVEGRRGLLGRSPVTTTSSTGFVAAPRSVLRQPDNRDTPGHDGLAANPVLAPEHQRKHCDWLRPRLAMRLHPSRAFGSGHTACSQTAGRQRPEPPRNRDRWAGLAPTPP